MRTFVRGPLALAIVTAATLLAGRALAQSAAAPAATVDAPPVDEEITVRGRKLLSEYRLEYEQALEDLIGAYNDENGTDDNDVVCKNERPTGSNVPRRVCRSTAQIRSETSATRWFMSALVANAGRLEGARGIGSIGATVAGAEASGEAAIRAAESSAKVQAELERLAVENPTIYRAVVKFLEAQDAYAEARAAVARSLAARESARCGASTTTEYLQQDTIARVSGKLEIADCAAASGELTVALRVKHENGEEKPLEFSETWQRSDDRDVEFAVEYPIGENVELVSARLSRLTCTCADPSEAEVPGAD